MANVMRLWLGGILGGIAGGYLAHRLTLSSVRAALGEVAGETARGREEDAAVRAARRERVAAGLRAEVESFVATYMEGLGSQVELLAPGQVLVAARPPQEYYFTMYDSNAAEITDAFKPSEVERIVRFYARAKGLVDALRGWEAASSVDYAGDEDRFAALGWAIDRLREVHRDVQRRLPEVLEVLGAGTGAPAPEAEAFALRAVAGAGAVTEKVPGGAAP